MPVESATFISDLVSTNPPGTDLEAQGANHLRLIKSVLQATLPVTGKAWNFPTSAAKSANYSVQKGDLNTLFIATTSGGAFTFTLPTLVSGDAGWNCEFMKIGSDVNPYFVAPPSGTLQSGEVTALSTARRCIPGRKTQAFWSGSSWLLTRVPSVPVGTVLDCWLNSLPIGYEWANGQTLSAVNYPDFNSFSGNSTPNMCGRASVGQDGRGGVTTNLITVAGGNYDSTALGSSGGGQSTTLLRSDLPNVAPTFTNPTYTFAGNAITSSNVPLSSSTWLGGKDGAGGNNIPITAGAVSNIAGLTPSGSVNLNIGGSVQSLNGGVAQTTPTNLPPTIVLAKVIVVE